MEIKPPGISQTATTASRGTVYNPAQQVTNSGQILTAVVESVEARSDVAAQRSLSGSGQTLFDVLLNANGQRIQTQSEQAFTTGQVLRVQIQADASLRVLQVLRNAPGSTQDPVQLGLSQALPLQQNPAPLLNNLPALLRILNQAATPSSPTPSTTAPVPTPAQLTLGIKPEQSGQLQASLNRLLSSLPRLDQLRHPQVLRQAIGNSGNLFEARLANILQNPTQRGEQASPVQEIQQQPLRILLQENPTIAQTAERLTTQDLKAQLLQLARTLLPLLPAQQGSSAATANAAEAALINRILQWVQGNTSGQNPGLTDSRQSDTLRLPQAPLNTDLNGLANQLGNISNSEPAAANKDRFDLAVSTVLRQLAASLSRIQANQLSTLAAQQPAAEGALQNQWFVDIPVFSSGQFSTVQLQIEEELYPQQQESEGNERLWKITLGFDLEGLGEFYATLRIAGSSLSTTFWSETPGTLSRIRNELDHLKGSLQGLGLEVNQIECRAGTPPLKHTRLEQQLVNTKA